MSYHNIEEQNVWHVFDQIIKYTGTSSVGSHTYEIHRKGRNKQVVYSSRAPKKYVRELILQSIASQVSKTTIRFEEKDLTLDDLKRLYTEISESYDPPSYTSTSLPEIANVQNLSPEEINEVRLLKKGQDASRWKSSMRSQRKKGKLTQYQIDALNKLGMIWHPSGANNSHDEWEKKYLAFRKYGLCFEIKSWVLEQRTLFNENNMPKENLHRLQAAEFPFISSDKESFKLTRSSCYALRETLEKKIKSLEVKELKKHGVYEEKEKPNLTTEELKEIKNRNQEYNQFLSKQYSFCNPLSINKLNKEIATNEIRNIAKGVSYKNKRLELFLKSETIKFKQQNKEIPYFIQNAYDYELSLKKLNDEEIYLELSQFNQSGIKKDFRVLACQIMLNYLGSINLNQSKFKEIPFLVSHYVDEKNLMKLNELNNIIHKYPLLTELYGKRILRALTTLRK